MAMIVCIVARDLYSLHVSRSHRLVARLVDRRAAIGRAPDVITYSLVPLSHELVAAMKCGVPVVRCATAYEMTSEEVVGVVGNVVAREGRRCWWKVLVGGAAARPESESKW